MAGWYVPRHCVKCGSEFIGYVSQKHCEAHIQREYKKMDPQELYEKRSAARKAWLRSTKPAGWIAPDERQDDVDRKARIRYANQIPGFDEELAILKAAYAEWVNNHQ